MGDGLRWFTLENPSTKWMIYDIAPCQETSIESSAIQEPGTVPSVSQYSTQATEGQVESDDSDQAMVSSWVWMAGWPYHISSIFQSWRLR